MKRIFFVALMALFLAVAGRSEAADYSRAENWAYCETEETDKPVDVFFLCPSVQFGNPEDRSMKFSDETARANFVGATNMEKGIYDGNARFFAPYYRAAALSVYELPEEERAPYLKLAYADVRAAFLYYLAKYNDGRPIILAGFSQGGDHVLRLMKEFCKDEHHSRHTRLREEHRLKLNILFVFVIHFDEPETVCAF